MEYLLYLAPLVLYAAWSLARSRAAARAAGEAAAGSGPHGPRHPAIDPAKCIGCGACIGACPEAPGHIVLALVAGTAALVGPEHCRGHGACRAACPTGAITLESV